MSQHKPPRQLHLGAFVQVTGHHVAGWRHPGAQADAGRNLAHYVALAQRAEAAGFDALFLADGVAIRGMDEATLPRTARAATFEPLTLLSALAAVTHRIGLVATASTTYNEPYHVARKFASLDHLSGGRAGWNVVTSWSDAEARNFSLERHPAHADRYARAEEFVDVSPGCGTPGRTMPFSTTRPAACISMLTSCTRSTIAARISRCADRSTSHVRRRAIP